MAFKDILKLKKEEVQVSKIFECEHLVIGNDIYTLETMNILKSRFPESKIIGIYKGEFKKDACLIKGPIQLRGQKNIEKLQGLYPDLLLKDQFEETKYLKDSKWKSFNGRGKSEKLMWSERFYTDKRVALDYEQIFNVLKHDESYPLDQLKKSIKNTQVSSIIKKDEQWIIEGVNGETYKTKNLYWGDGPWSFLNAFEEKNLLSNDFIEFCEQTQVPCSLYVEFEFDQVVSDKMETLFMPLSYTHDWGHFIGEFRNTAGGQIASFVTFLDKNHTSEEEVSKKIKILKKNLEKIFPLIKNSNSVENISLEEKSESLSINDKLYNKSCFEFDSLYFFGTNSPIKSETEDDFSFSHLTRSLLALEDIKSL